MRPLFGFSISRVFLLFHDNVVMLILLHFLSLLEIKSPDWKGKNEPQKDGYPDYNTGNMSDKIMPESQVISCKFFHCFATLKLVLNVTELRANQSVQRPRHGTQIIVPSPPHWNSLSQNRETEQESVSFLSINVDKNQDCRNLLFWE